MAETVVSKERINLGGKSLGRILSLLAEQGWKNNNNALKYVDLQTMMRHGDRYGAEFRHVPKAIIVNGQVIIRVVHTDYLKYENNLLTRACSTDGREIVSSAVVKG